MITFLRQEIQHFHLPGASLVSEKNSLDLFHLPLPQFQFPFESC
jgi:hypothetical protein